MVQPSLVLVTTCVPFWCWTSNGSLSKGGVALVLDSFFTSIASPTWISNVFMPFFPSACAFICIFFSTQRKSCRNSSWKSSRLGMIPSGNLAWNMQLGNITGFDSVEKYFNFRGSPRKVLKFLCKSLKSSWIFFNFECTCTCTCTFYLSVNVFSTNVLIGDTIFYVSNWRRDRHFTWSSEPREGLACCSAKGVPSFLGYFKTLKYWSGPRNQTATSRSAVNTLYRLS